MASICWKMEEDLNLLANRRRSPFLANIIPPSYFFAFLGLPFLDSGAGSSMTLSLGLPFLVWVLLSLTGSSMMLSALKSTWTCQVAKYVQNSSSPPLPSTKLPSYLIHYKSIDLYSKKGFMIALDKVCI